MPLRWLLASNLRHDTKRNSNGHSVAYEKEARLSKLPAVGITNSHLQLIQRGHASHADRDGATELIVAEIPVTIPRGTPMLVMCGVLETYNHAAH